ncbi:hypothetical protein TNCV_824581 [Trichonephila clavipes]|nr:hypothetical protein TNCV_824581 [Trichonephila clavipes]
MRAIDDGPCNFEQSDKDDILARTSLFKPHRVNGKTWIFNEFNMHHNFYKARRVRCLSKCEKRNLSRLKVFSSTCKATRIALRLESSISNFYIKQMRWRPPLYMTSFKCPHGRELQLDRSNTTLALTNATIQKPRSLDDTGKKKNTSTTTTIRGLRFQVADSKPNATDGVKYDEDQIPPVAWYGCFECGVPVQVLSTFLDHDSKLRDSSQIAIDVEFWRVGYIFFWLCVVAPNATCLTVSDRDPCNSSRQRTRLTPVVIPYFEHRTGDSQNWFGSTPVLREHPG